jgi:hypothetical protein
LDLLAGTATLDLHGGIPYRHGLHLSERGHVSNGGVWTAPDHPGAVDYLLIGAKRDRRQGVTLAYEHDQLSRTDLQLRHLFRLRGGGNDLAGSPAQSRLDGAID